MHCTAVKQVSKQLHSNQFLLSGLLIIPQPDQEGNQLQRQKILSFNYPIYNHNWRNNSTIYIYKKTNIKRNILSIKQNTSESTYQRPLKSLNILLAKKDLPLFLEPVICINCSQLPVQSRTSKLHEHGPRQRVLLVRFRLILTFYLRCDIKTDKKQDNTTLFAQQRRLKFKGILCTNVTQSAVAELQAASVRSNFPKRPDPPWVPLSPYPINTESAVHHMQCRC